MDGDRCAVQWLRWTVGEPPKGGYPDEHRYQLDDRLGSSVIEVDVRGRLISYEEYAPYGGTTYASGASLAEVSRKHYRFSGKQRDTESGLSYFGARYYAPWLGRWINPDPAGTVDGLNLYEYVGSNPVAWVDPLGLAKNKKKTKKKVGPDPKVLKARKRALKLFGKGRKNFYPALKKIAALARSGDVAGVAKATKLADLMENDKAFREEIAKRVRVRAVKAGGAKKGYGKDELFQTSETAFVFKLSAGLIPGKAPTALFKGPSGAVQEVTMLDAQEHIRLDTSIVPTKEGEGHTGMLRATKTSAGYMTTGQAAFHAARTGVMTSATSTGEAILNVVASHINSTANVTTMQSKHTTGFTVTNQDLSKKTDRKAFIDQQAKVRDQNKMVVEELKTRLYEPGMTAVTYTQAPLSPRHDPTYTSTTFTKAQKIDEFGTFFNFGLPTFSSTKK
jgi:RHS repeat-associated protein